MGLDRRTSGQPHRRVSSVPMRWLTCQGRSASSYAVLSLRGRRMLPHRSDVLAKGLNYPLHLVERVWHVVAGSKPAPYAWRAEINGLWLQAPSRLMGPSRPRPPGRGRRYGVLRRQRKAGCRIVSVVERVVAIQLSVGGAPWNIVSSRPTPTSRSLTSGRSGWSAATGNGRPGWSGRRTRTCSSATASRTRARGRWPAPDARPTSWRP